MRLKDTAKVQTGLHFRGRLPVHRDGQYHVIQIKDVDSVEGLRTSDLARAQLDSATAEKYLVDAGDVLFLSRGPRQYAIHVAQPLFQTVAPSYFYILRPHLEFVLPEYLAWYINQEPFRSNLRNHIAGSHMLFVPKATFELLEIPVPSLNEQRTIVELVAMLGQEERLSAEIMLNRKKLVESSCLAAANRGR